MTLFNLSDLTSTYSQSYQICSTIRKAFPFGNIQIPGYNQISSGTSLEVQWLRLRAPSGQDKHLVLGQVIRAHIPQQSVHLPRHRVPVWWLRVCMSHLKVPQGARKIWCSQIHQIHQSINTQLHLIMLLYSPWGLCDSSETPWTVAPPRLLSWDFPGKNTGVGWRFLLQGPLRPTDWTCVSCISRQFLTLEPPGKPAFLKVFTSISEWVQNFFFFQVFSVLTMMFWEPSSGLDCYWTI